MKIETDLKFILDIFSWVFFSYKRYQTGISKQKIKPETIDFTMISSFRGLLHLHCSWWLTCYIIEATVHALHLIDNSAHNLLQHIKRNI